MKLSRLLSDLPLEVLGEGDPEVTGIAYDSRRVSPGDLFVALVGQRFDGRVFAPQAVERGAVAVLAQGPPPPGPAVGMPWASAARPRDLLGPIASRLHDAPDRELVMVGVTGTNGKSTVVALSAAMLECAGRPAGVLGTLGYRFRDLALPGERTTPEASDLFRVLRQMRAAGAEAVSMEVSSHALAQGRVAGVSFDVAVFTNLSRDHLDFHRDLESYFAAKRRLFDQLAPGGRAVVHTGDPYGRRLAAELGDVLTFGDGGEVRCLEAAFDLGGTRGVLRTPRGEIAFRTPLLGRYNLDNVVAAAAVAEALGLAPESVAEALRRQRPLPGRLEPVTAGQEFPVLVDYAHTDAALEAALRSVRELTGKRVVLVFGCGGDRDPGKRALMGRVAGDLADLPIATSDNPRREDPQTILTAVEEGLKQSRNERYRVFPDRRQAIRKAIALAGPGDVVLVAGKGHERVQIVGDRELPFSDREEIEKALEDRLGTAKRR